MNTSLSAVHPSVCGGSLGAFDEGGEVQRAEDHVPAGGSRCSVLQPSPAHPHSGQHALPTQPTAHHRSLHKPVDERHRVLPGVRRLACSAAVYKDGRHEVKLKHLDSPMQYRT